VSKEGTLNSRLMAVTSALTPHHWGTLDVHLKVFVAEPLLLYVALLMNFSVIYSELVYLVE
jgi:hypothetical protein